MEQKIKRRFVSPLMLSLALFAFESTVAQTNNSVAGFVYGSGRVPLADLPVELQNEFNQLISRTKTDGSGRYTFLRSPQGRLYIKVYTLGTDYEEQSAEIQITNFTRQGVSGPVTSGSENVQRDFYLRTKNAARGTLKTVGTIFAQDIPREAKGHYDSAVSRIKDGNKHKEAIGELTKAVAIFPDYYLALENLAQEYIKLDDFENATRIASKAVKINPKGFVSWYTLGFAYYKVNSLRDAEKALLVAQSLNSASVNTLFVLGVISRSEGKFADSEAYLLKAKKLANSLVPEIHWQLALLYTNNLKRYAAAVEELELFLKASPNYPETEKVKSLIKKLKTKA